MDIQFLPGVGPKRAELLRKELGVGTVGELLRLYPFRYIDRSSFMRIADARSDMAFVQFRARVLRVDLYGRGGDDGRAGSMDMSSAGGAMSAKEKALKFNTVKRMSVWVGDGSGEMELVFFKGIKWMYERLTTGSEWVFFGKPAAFNGRLNIVHPEVDAVPAGAGVSDDGDRECDGRDWWLRRVSDSSDWRNDDRRISEHGEAEEQRHHRQGDEQADGSGTEQGVGGSRGNSAGIYNETVRPCADTLRFEEHSFPEGYGFA